MAKTAASRATSAKPAEKKSVKEVKANGTAPRKGAKKSDDAPATNGVAEENKAADEKTEEVEAPAQKRKGDASESKPSLAKNPAAAARSRAKKTETPAAEPKVATKKTTKRKKDEESEQEAEEAPAPAVKKAKVNGAKAAPKAAPKAVPKPAPEAAPETAPEGEPEASPEPTPEAASKVESKAPTPQAEPKAKVNPALIPNPKGPRRAKGKKTEINAIRYTEPLKVFVFGEGGSDDSDSDSEDETGGLNDEEATPKPVPAEFFPEDTTFVDVAAGDSCSFALTTEGAVYGWGTFRKNEGILGFERGNHTAPRPVYLDTVKKVTQIVCGTNHVYVLDKDRHVYAWGNGQQNQLGRRVTERNLHQALQPNRIGFHDTSIKKHSQRIASIASGDYHGLAIAEDGHIWAWGANNYCETGYTGNAGAEDASVLQPKIIHSLEGKSVESLAAGAHHNLAITKDGQVLVWGRCDGAQTGLPPSELDAETDEDKVLKNNGKAKIVVQPTPLPNLKNVVTGACGPDHSIVIDKDGKAYSWGFSANYQTGQGTDDDIEVPTMIDNTAVRETKLTWAGCGGQYSILASKKE
ncbi:regulator of chromosome condensation 1/beta-lactamase-inhibitor protein II [Bipolaris maydis]|nr:regulator of chromosome condensation 1/beta-lactamase-inhibitor protein II [Bipolaris maydis]KAJ6194487.1 regulator of chromosome condensation 1/beta-lactamase-inhibitor protein II [Bipolaris maydis]